MVIHNQWPQHDLTRRTRTFLNYTHHETERSCCIFWLGTSLRIAIPAIDRPTSTHIHTKCCMRQPCCPKHASPFHSAGSRRPICNLSPLIFSLSTFQLTPVPQSWAIAKLVIVWSAYVWKHLLTVTHSNHVSLGYGVTVLSILSMPSVISATNSPHTKKLVNRVWNKD